MIIAIDYDFTYKRDPTLFYAFIQQAQSRGHTVICVTGRIESQDFPKMPSFPQGVKIIYSGGAEKRKAAEKAGHKVDIWIDEMPETIGQCVKL